MSYLYRFYRFPSASAWLATAAAAGLAVDDQGAPIAPMGAALDVVGTVTETTVTDPAADPPVVQTTTLPGWHVNAAWPGAEPPEFASYAIDHFAGLRAFAGWDTPAPPPPVPAAVARWQMRAELRERGLLDQVETLIAQQPLDVQEWWNGGTEVQRTSPTLLAFAAALSLSSDQVDGMFRSAAARQL